MNRKPARERAKAWAAYVKRRASHNATLPQHAETQPDRASFNAGYTAGRRSVRAEELARQPRIVAGLSGGHGPFCYVDCACGQGTAQRGTSHE